MTYPFAMHGTCAAITETLYPSSTVSDAEWTPDGTVHEETDTESDLDFAFLLITGGLFDECPTIGTQGTNEYEVHIANPTGEPGSSDCQKLTIEWRVAKDDNEGENTGTVNMRIRLYDGATLIVTDTETDIGLTETTFTRLLSDANYDNITDHDDLRFKVFAEGCADTAPDQPSALAFWTRLQYEAQ